MEEENRRASPLAGAPGYEIRFLPTGRGREYLMGLWNGRAGRFELDEIYSNLAEDALTFADGVRRVLLHTTRKLPGGGYRVGCYEPGRGWLAEGEHLHMERIRIPAGDGKAAETFLLWAYDGKEGQNAYRHRLYDGEDRLIGVFESVSLSGEPYEEIDYRTEGGRLVFQEKTDERPLFEAALQQEVETEDVQSPAEGVQEAPADDIVPDGDPAPVVAGQPADTGKNGGKADSQPGESEADTQEESLPGETEEAEYGQLAISGQYDGLRNAQDGITIVSKNGKWGLVSYENEVLVPLEYDYACNSPNDDGQTFFGNDGDFRVFDREGNEIFRTDRTITAVSDGVVLWEETDPDSYTMDYGYVRLDGTVLYEPVEEQTSGQAGAVGFNEGYAICTDYLCEQRLSTDGELFPIFDARYPLRHPELAEPPVESSTMESSADSSDGDLFYPIGALYQGYYVSWGMPFEDVLGDIYIYDKDGTEEYPLQIRDLARYAGFSWEDPELYWTVWGFQDNGVLCHSYGTILCISLEDGEKKQYFLIDAAKQDHTTDRFGYYAEPVITDASILATGDYIGIDQSRYWLIQKDGQWGYIDHDGNIVAFFDDATRFSNGMAMVIEDGYARFINEDMETCSDRIPAQTVAAYVDIFAVTTPDGEQLCFESSAPQAVKGSPQMEPQNGGRQ